MKNNSRRPQNNRSKSNGRQSDLNPQLLIKSAQKKVTKTYVSKLKIVDLPIDKQLITILQKKGFERPSEIQEKTIASLLDGKNMLGIAQTGTGKTGAFLIPIINKLLANRKNKSFGLVVVPTRELAVQVNEEFKSMTKGLGLTSNCFIGGTNISRDIQELKKGQHLLVATPGRLLDLENRKAVNLNYFKVLVLDEFDRMLDMGFAKDVDQIIAKMNGREQSMLFSATLDHQQSNRIKEILGNYETVKVTSGQDSSDRVDQDIVVTSGNEDKFNKLMSLLSDDDYSRVIVFDETKHRVKRLCVKLNKAGIRSADIQGNRSQSARQKALSDFKRGAVRVLVATDVAGRGIDVSDVSHVINYELPSTYDSYIHRIGRTGRAGKNGVALTFVDSGNKYLKSKAS